MAVTCQPYVTVGQDKHGRGYRAICRRHKWQSQVWGTRPEAIRSAAAHKRAKRLRGKKKATS